MKVSKLLAMSALLLTGSSVAEAALVDGVRQKPEPKTTAFEWNTTLYMYNTGVKKYFLGANSWDTRASVSDKGYKVKFTKHIEDGLEWDGSAAILNDSVETKKAWFKTFIGDADGVCWVDCNNNADTIWAIKSVNDGWRISASEYNPAFNSSTYPDTFFGVKAGDENATPELFAFLTEEDNVDWKFVSQEDYALHQEAIAVYKKAEELRALMTEAQTLGVDYSAAKAVYENEASTMEEIEAAIAALDKAIVEAKENIATVDNPSDLTSKIVNPGYENANTGWSGTAPAFGFGAAEFYNKAYNGYQQLTGLPNGVYAVSLSAFYRAGNSEPAYQNWKKNNAEAGYAKLYAAAGEDSVRTSIMSPFVGVTANNSLGGNESSVIDGEYTYYIPNNMETAANYFNAGYYAGNTVLVATTDGTLTIGLEKKTTIGGDWTLFDNWKLTYYGNKPEAYALWMSSVLKDFEGDAEPGEDVVYTYSALDDYKAVLDEVKGASDKDAIFAAIKQLEAAKADLQANIAAWTDLLAAVEKAREVASRPNSELAGEDKDKLADYVDFDFEDILAERTLTTEEVIAETEKVKKMTQDAIQNGLVVGQKFEIPNPGFEDGATGWQGNPTIGGSTNKCAEAYQKKFDVYQIVKGAPQGVYSINVQAFFRDGLNDAAWAKYLEAEGNVTSPITVYLNGSTTPIKNLYDEKVTDADYFDATADPAPYQAEDNDGNMYWFANDMKNASVMFADGKYKSQAFGLVAKKGDDMRIGIKGDASASGNWAIWDNFELIYEGFKAEIIQPVLETAADALNSSVDKTMGTEVRDKINGVVENAADALEQTDGEVMFNALVEVMALSDSIAKSEAVFTELNNMIDPLGEAIFQSANKAVKAEAEALIEKMQEAVGNGGTVTTAEAAALIASCKDVTIRLALPEGTASASNPLDYTALIQNPNFEKDGVNSIESWNGTSGYNFGNDDTQKSTMMVEFYNKTFDMYQDIALSEVPNGYYKLTLSAFNRHGGIAEDYEAWSADPDNSEAKLYAVSGGKTVETPIALLSSGAGEEKLGIGDEVATGDGNIYVPNDMVSANAYFTLDNPRYVNELVIKVTDGKLRVGIKKETNVDTGWVIMDTWRLTYTGNDMPTDGIENVNGTVGTPVKVEYFSIDGMKLSKPSKGVVIMRATDAAGNVTVKTVVVK